MAEKKKEYKLRVERSELGNSSSPFTTLRRESLPVIDVSMPPKPPILSVTDVAVFLYCVEVVVHLLSWYLVHDSELLFTASSDGTGVEPSVESKLDVKRSQPCPQRDVLVIIDH